MPLDSSHARPTLVSKKMVPGLLIVSLTLCLSSVSGGAVIGRGGWSYHGGRGKGAGGVRNRRPAETKVSATSAGQKRGLCGVAVLCPCFGAACAHCCVPAFSSPCHRHFFHIFT